MFMVSFSFRFTASYILTDKAKIVQYNDIAYDLQALLAVFLWVKTLSLLDGNQYFGMTGRIILCYNQPVSARQLTLTLLTLTFSSR